MRFSDMVKKQRRMNKINAGMKKRMEDFTFEERLDQPSGTGSAIDSEMREILNSFYHNYDYLLEVERTPGFNSDLYYEYMDRGDRMISDHDPMVERFNTARSEDYGFPDILSSDREVVAFYMAVKRIDPQKLMR